MRAGVLNCGGYICSGKLNYRSFHILRPGHYSRLHGLQNFRSVFEGLSATEDGGMTAIIARIKNSLTEQSSTINKQVTISTLVYACFNGGGNVF